MPSLSMIMGILLAVCFAWGSAATWYAADLIEQKATVESALHVANGETLKQIEINGELRADVAAEQRALSVLGKERTNDEIRFAKELARINDQRTRAEGVARQHPERYGVAATYDLRRSMRDVCRRGGGTKADCKIDPVQAPAPRPGIASDGELGNASSLERAQPEFAPALRSD